MTRGAAVGGRDVSIDVVRGLSIVSMVLAHVAYGSWGYELAHAALYVDGAHGFVLLSGLVVGLVQRKYVARGGARTGQLKAARRARLIYGGHVALCVMAFTMVAVDPARNERYASVGDQGGWWGAVWRTLTLQINPPQASILSLYVVLLLLTVGAVWMLSRGWWWLVAVASGLLYMAGATMPGVTTLPRELGQIGEINWAMWQVLFFGALLIGWHWDRPGIQRAISSPATRVVALAIVATIVSLGYLQRAELAPDLFNRYAGRALASGQLGPGTVVLAFAGVLVLYALGGWVAGHAGRLVAPVATIGRRSLDCYVGLSILVLLVPDPLGWDRDGWLAHLVSAVVLVLMWTWCTLRDRGVVQLPNFSTWTTRRVSA